MNDRHGALETSVRSDDRTRLIYCAQTTGGFGRRCFFYCPTNMKGTWVTVSPTERGKAQPFTASSMQWARPG